MPINQIEDELKRVRMILELCFRSFVVLDLILFWILVCLVKF